MNSNETKNTIAKDYFERFPNNSECFITSDNRVFHTQGSALGIATSLPDNTIACIKKDQIESNQDNEDLEDEILNFDAENALYPEVKKLVQKADLKPASLKLPDLLEAIENEKTRLLNK